MYLSHFGDKNKEDEKEPSSEPRELFVGVKMINWRGHMILRPGTNVDVRGITGDQRATDAYRILKFLRVLSDSPAKSYTIKKVLSDVLKWKSYSSEAPGSSAGNRRIVRYSNVALRSRTLARDYMRWSDTYELVNKVLRSEELEGMFSSGAAAELEERGYAVVDVGDLPSKGAGVHLVRRQVAELHLALREGRDGEVERMDVGSVLSRERRDGATVAGRTSLHEAVAKCSPATVKRILNRGCKVNQV